ncbi:centrosomal protein of 152 kDa-like isoform X2 [Bacillus rossius redtenbacheri]
MNGPDNSLFQASDGFMIQNFNQADDVEREAEEDRIRRNKELNECLEKEFGNIFEGDDDESDDNDERNNSDDDTNYTASGSDVSGVVQAGDEAALAKPGQFYANGTADQDYPEGDSAILDSALTAVLQMSMPAENHYASGLQSRLSSVPEEEEMFESQDYQQTCNINTSDHYLYCCKLNPECYRDHKAVNEYPQSLNENELYREMSYNGTEQLQVLYDVRVREVQRLQQELQAARDSAVEKQDRMSQELMLTEAEKNKAECLHREAEKRLFTSQKKIEELEKDVDRLKLNVRSLEELNTQLKQELESSQASNNDLHQKLMLLERSNLSNSNKHYDSFVKNCQKKHEQELQMWRTKFDGLNAKLEDKEAVCDRLEQRLAEQTRANEALMLEKSETINQLGRSLEESQRRYQQLVGDTVGQDTLSLTVQLSVVTREKEQLHDRVKQLEKEVESLKFDLQQYENGTRLGIFNNEDSLFSDSMIQLGIAKSNNNSTKLSKSEESNICTALRDELCRSLIGQKIKREEISRLKSELETKEKVIKTLKQAEEKYLSDLKKFKEDVQVQMTLLKEQDQLSKEIENYEKKNKGLSQQLEQCESELSLVKNELDSIKKVRNVLEQENAQLKQDIDKITTEFENEKALAYEHCSKEFLHFHEEALAKVKEEKHKEVESRVYELRTQLDQVYKESQEAKLSYIQLSSEKSSLLEELCEARKNVENLTSQLLAKEEELVKVSNELKVQQNLSERLSNELENSQEKMDSLTQTLESEKIGLKEQEMNIGGIIKNDESLQEIVDEKAKQLYRTKVTEEINAAKMEALQEIENDWKKQEDRYKIKIKQLSDAYTLLREKVKDYGEKCTEADKNCKKQIQELQSKLQKQEFLVLQLKVKEKLMLGQNFDTETARSSFKDASTSPMRSLTEDLETCRTESARLHAKQLEALRLKYQLELEAQQERIKEETVNYFATQIINLEAKHKLTLQECEAKTANELLLLKDLIASQNNCKVDISEQVISVNRDSDGVLREKVQMLANELTASRSRLELKEKQLEETENKISELISNRKHEVQSLRKAYNEIKKRYAECAAKYKAAKLEAAKYKKLYDEKEKHLTKEYERVKDGYQNALFTIKKKVEEAVFDKENVIASQVIALEEQIQQLRQKLSRSEAA